MASAKEVSFEVNGERLAKDRTNYYDNWHKFAKDEIEKAKQDEEIEKEQANKALGLDSSAPKSEAEKADREKMEALKEAKKKWDQKQLGEASMKFAVEGLEDVDRVLDSVKLKWKPVITFKNNKSAKLRIPSDLKHKLIKIFVENCTDCTFDFEAPLVTQHIEVAHCKNCVFNVKETLATLQLDLSSGLHVKYSKGLFIPEKVKIYHAGVEKLKVETGEGHVHETCYLTTVSSEEKLPKEIQFVTHLLENELKTEKVIRDKGNLPATSQEIENAHLPAKSLIRQAELKRIGGNEAFSEKNYAQAAIFYTEAIDSIEQIKDEEERVGCDFLHVLYANRAFCWQKLGHHEKAESDGRASVKLQPEYVKGLFRLGLALHAQKKYFEAVPTLGQALRLEPKNDQIKQALGFAEIQLKKMMQQRDY